VNAEQIRFKRRPQPVARKILYRTGEAKRAVVENSVQRAACSTQCLSQASLNTVGIGVIQNKALQPIVNQCSHIAVLAYGCEDPPAMGVKCAGGMCADARRTPRNENGFCHVPPRI
jgi:hypothetical protein